VGTHREIMMTALLVMSVRCQTWWVHVISEGRGRTPGCGFSCASILPLVPSGGLTVFIDVLRRCK